MSSTEFTESRADARAWTETEELYERTRAGAVIESPPWERLSMSTRLFWRDVYERGLLHRGEP